MARQCLIGLARTRQSHYGLLGTVLLFSVLTAAGEPQQRDAALATSGRQAGAGTQTERRSGPAQPRDRENILEGTDADDTLDGGNGDDWLFGMAGHDVLRGGPGSDTLNGAAGDDTLTGGGEGDLLDGGAGRDLLFGGEGNDTGDGGDDEDTVDGGPGDDDLDGGDADDVLRGDAGDDAMVGGDGNDILSGGPGADRLFGQDGDDGLLGGPGNDVLEGGDGRDSLNGQDGDDALNGGEGDDFARGGAGNDVLKGDAGSDALSGETGDDTLLGSRGDDHLDGGEDNDILLGGDGQDALAGGPGDDWLLGGLGADSVRGGAEDDLILLRAGDVGNGENEVIDGAAGRDLLILNGFDQGEAPEPPAARPGLGDNSLSDPITGGAYHLFSIEQIQHTHLFTGVGTSGSRAASFVFVNPSRTAASAARIAFFDDEGAALALSIGGGPAQSTFAFTVPPLGHVAFDTSSPEQTVRGMAQVFADRALSGVVRTSLADLGPARVPEAPLLDSFIVPVREERATDASTGVVIVSSTVPSNVKLTLHTMAGEEVATQSEGGVEIDLPAHGQRVLFVREIFPYVGGDFQGTMTVEGGIDRPQDGGPLAALGIQHEGRPGAITTFPVIPVAPLPTIATLHFATLPSGGSYVSSIALVNPSPATRARGTLMFFDQAGQDRSVGITGRSAAATVPYDIGPLGSVVFTTSAAGPLRAGSARAETAEGVVGAVLRLDTPAGTVSAGPSGVFAGFIAPAQRDRATGLNTQVALSSTGSPLRLTLVLRDARGSEVLEGRVEVQLPANGQMVQTIDALFPDVDTDALQGTLTVTADGGPVAADVMQLAGDPGGLTVMPVAPLR